MNAITLPKELDWFGKSVNPLWIYGMPSERERGALRCIRSVAKFHYNSGSTLEPSETAKAATLQAVRDFWNLAISVNEPFPLSKYNRCMGMAVVPRTRLVLVAVSHDKCPEVDEPLRNHMLQLINKINKSTERWIYELTRIPTQSEYLLLRTLALRTPLDEEAPKEILSPIQWSASNSVERKEWMKVNSQVRPNWFSKPNNGLTHRCIQPLRCEEACQCGKSSRCIEIALMVGLCKAGRFKKFEPSEVCVMAFGCTLWTLPYNLSTNDVALELFAKGPRNRKYICKSHLVQLEGKYGYFDEWNPCPQHCGIYRKAMLAIGAAGGPGSSFPGPRSETCGAFFIDIHDPSSI